MASIPGSQYDVYAGGQTINFGVTTDPNTVPPPVGGDFNLEVVVNATGTGSYNTASGYQGLAILSTDGHTLTLLHGDYKVTDDGSSGGGNDHIFLGDGAESSINQSWISRAASRKETSSFFETKSMMLPPHWHCPKQFQQFFATLTRKCVVLVPP